MPLSQVRRYTSEQKGDDERERGKGEGGFSVLLIGKRSIKILTLGIVGNFPFVYSSVSRTYIMSKVNK